MHIIHVTDNIMHNNEIPMYIIVTIHNCIAKVCDPEGTSKKIEQHYQTLRG